jgi:hypothetical protein
MSMSLHFRFHPETLREIVDDPVALTDRIATLAALGVGEGASGESDDPAAFDARCEYVALLRIAGRLDDAALEAEMNLAAADLTGDMRRMVRAMLLLGHVRQWRQEWDAADTMFHRAEKLALYLDDDRLVAFSAQHSGKSFYDQGKHVEAALRFRLALEIRERIGAPSDQVESSRLALSAAMAQL